jgi:hypothetical protein
MCLEEYMKIKSIVLPLIALVMSLTISKATYAPKIEALQVQITKEYRSNHTETWGSYHLLKEVYKIKDQTSQIDYNESEKLEKLVIKNGHIFFIHIVKENESSQIKIEEFPFEREGSILKLNLHSQLMQKKDIYDSLLQNQITAELRSKVKSFSLKSGQCERRNDKFVCELDFRIFI